MIRIVVEDNEVGDQIGEQEKSIRQDEECPGDLRSMGRKGVEGRQQMMFPEVAGRHRIEVEIMPWTVGLRCGSR